MTGPMVQPPNISQGPVIQDPGLGGAMAGALGQVLAAMQQKREEEYRQQVLAQKTSEAQMQAKYQQGLLAVQQRQLSVQTTASANSLAAAQQVGGVQRRAMMGSQPPSPTQVPGQPQAQPGVSQQPGTQTQSGTGLFHDVFAGGSAALAPAEGHADIFGGVSDENVPAAVQGLQEVKALQPKAAEPTTNIRDFAAWSQLNGIDPVAGKKFWELIGPKPGTVVNVGQGGEQQFDKSYAEAQAKELSEAETSATKAANASRGMVESYGLVGKALTGFGANAKLNVSRMAIALGVAPEAVKQAAGDTQALMKLTGDRVLDLMATKILGSSTAVSDTDLRFSQEQSGRDLTKEPTALKKTIRINMGAGMMLQQDAVDHLREQAQYASPQTSRQLLGKADARERALEGQWVRYASMLRDEGEQAEAVLERIPQRVRERVAPQIRKLFVGQGGLGDEAAKIPGVILPGAR